MSAAVESVLRQAAAAAAAGEYKIAERLSREILERDPRNPHALSWLGIALASTGRHSEAESFFRQAAAVDPKNPHMHFNLGNTLTQVGAFDQALLSFERALELRPEYPEALNNLGRVLAERGTLEEAIGRFRQAISLRPDYAEAHDNLGDALLRLGREEAAIDSFRRAVALQPDDADFQCDLGNGLSAQQHWEEAIARFERALALDPAFFEAHYNLAVARLHRHEFEQGWALYERRLQVRKFLPSARKNLASVALYEQLPRWQGPGEPVRGGAAIWGEQGIGDQVLFSTLIPELIEAGVSFIYEVDHRLLMAYERAFPGHRFVAYADPPHGVLRQASRVLLAGSLPGMFRTSRASFARQPAKLLAAQPERVAHYLPRLAALGPGLKVALSWRSTRKDYWGPRKNVSLNELAPLLRLAGLHFVDVQYGDTTAERRAVEDATGARLMRFEEVDHYNDLEELLAILEASDLVVTTSNATAHFAGALGKRTWLLYPADRPPFYYWAHGGSYRSLWYPSVEIVTAPHLADWASLIQHVAEKLKSVTSDR